MATLMFQEIITPWIYLHQNRRGKETEKYEQHTYDLVTPAYVSYDIVVHVIRQSFLAFQVLFPFPPNVMLKLKYIPCVMLSSLTRTKGPRNEMMLSVWVPNEY